MIDFEGNETDIKSCYWYSNIRITTEKHFYNNAHKDIFTLSNQDIKLSTFNLVTHVISNSTM